MTGQQAPIAKAEDGAAHYDRGRSRRPRDHPRTDPQYAHRRSGSLSDQLLSDVFLKLETLQRTGSFKVRGALVKLDSLSPQQQQGRDRRLGGQPCPGRGLRAAATCRPPS